MTLLNAANRIYHGSSQAAAVYLAATKVWPSVSAEASQFLTRTSGLDTIHTNAYTALIDGLVTNSVWAKLDVLRIYATADTTTALLNLKSSSFIGVANGSPAFTVDRGFTGVNASATVYINSQFNPTTASSPQYTQNSAHISAWNLTNTSSTSTGGIVIGNNFGPGGQTNIIPKFNDGNVYFRIQGSNIGGVANANAIGHYIANRSASNALQGYKNGSSILTSSDASTVLLNQNVFDLAASQNTGPGFGGGFQIAATSIGSSLSATDATNFYNRLRTYMTAVGVP